MEEFFKICSLSDLTENRGRRFLVDDVDIAVFKIGDNIYAINNICPHQHAAVLCDGYVEGCTVLCPAHGWGFDLTTGNYAEGAKGVDSYEVKVENSDVFVKVFKRELKW